MVGSEQKYKPDDTSAYSIDLSNIDDNGYGYEKKQSNPPQRYNSQPPRYNSQPPRSNEQHALRNAPKRNNKRMHIILGVVIGVSIVAIVAVVIPVAVIGNKNRSSTSSSQKDTAVCGPYNYPGVNISALQPRIISVKKTCPLKGDCWTGEQCYECFKLPRWKVANINNIPVCCKNCEMTGLGISSSECYCLHNGYSSG